MLGQTAPTASHRGFTNYRRRSAAVRAVVVALVSEKPMKCCYLQSNQTQPQSPAPTMYRSQVSDTA